MNIKNILITILLVFFYPSCAMDYTANAVIENATGKEVTVTVFYNREFVDSTTQKSTNVESNFLRYAGSRTGIKNHRLDSASFSVLFTLQDQENLPVVHVPGGSGVEPLYDEIDSINVRYHQHNQTVDRSMLKNLFLKKESGLWSWVIR